MGKVIRNTRWTKASAYKPKGPKGPWPPRPASGKLSARWFPVALVALPLGVFSAILFFPATGSAPTEAEAAPVDIANVQSAPMDQEEAYFPICSGPRRVTCVVDGDTIWYRGEKIRLVGFDAPEVGSPGCAREAQLGREATRRLQDWLNEGAFSLDANPEGRERDRYGRALLVVSRAGANLGDVLIDEGLAERRGGRTNVWC